MISEEKIRRINELSRKSRESGLTEAEKLEQQQLRNEYIAAVRARTKEHLDRIRIVDDIGNPSSKKS